MNMINTLSVKVLSVVGFIPVDVIALVATMVG